MKTSSSDGRDTLTDRIVTPSSGEVLVDGKDWQTDFRHARGRVGDEGDDPKHPRNNPVATRRSDRTNACFRADLE